MVTLTQVIVTLATAYIFHTIYSLYLLFKAPICDNKPDSRCIESYLNRKPLMQMLVYTSRKQSRQSTLVWTSHLFRVEDAFEEEIMLKVPLAVRMNGSMDTSVVLRELEGNNVEGGKVKWSITRSSSLTSFSLRQPSQFNLMGDSEKNESSQIDLITPTSHWHSKLFISIIEEFSSLDINDFPPDIAYYLKLFSQKEYLPLVYIDELSVRVKDLMVLNESSSEMPLRVVYKACTFGKMRFWINMQHSLETFIQMGFTTKDLDEVKGIFVDTNLLLLLLTFLVSAFHLLFDVLAFKNDISFWRKRKDMVGLSTWSMAWRCFSSIIIFFFLLDQQTSLLILIPSAVSLVIEMWKMTKAFKVRVWREGWRMKMKMGGDEIDGETQTEAFDTQAMKALSYLLLPLVLVGAVYSLLYTPHKGWYSWTIQSLSNGVYAFGFVFMLPQLFINYKLKSVAHLPWKAFTYKAFNTFIDDIFAFIITMPTTHRLACFRDDIIFVIYLYQRWLYPVDKKRMNEFGESFEAAERKQDGVRIEGVVDKRDEEVKKKN